MAYGDFKDLARKTASDKISRDKAFNIARNLKYDGHQRGVVSTACNCFDKKTAARAIRNEIMQNKGLAEELHKSTIRKFEERKVYSCFIDNILGADLSDKQLTSKFNKWFRFLLRAINIYSKYVWVIHLKDGKGTTITNSLQNILSESNRKPNKIWVDKGSEFYKRSMKSWLEKNDIEMYSIHNGGNSNVAQSFFRILKNKY